VQYRFKPLEYNGLKGTIGEQIARSFIRHELGPRLKREEGWSRVVLSHNDYKRHAPGSTTKLFSYDEHREDFYVHGVAADRKLLATYASTVAILRHGHCTPDGLLLKLKDTGKTRQVSEAECPTITRLRVDEAQKVNGAYVLPVVEGNVEVVEIKCGRTATLMHKQQETYGELMGRGVPLRRIDVRIVSFDLNQFLVEEHQVSRP
jgi:hypothetical protein